MRCREGGDDLNQYAKVRFWSATGAARLALQLGIRATDHTA
jgi:hypothetical protein